LQERDVNKIFAFLSAAVLLVLANGVPAHATDGRTAVGACIDNPTGCTYECEASGDCLLTVGGKIIHCPTPTGECVVVGTAKVGPKGPIIAAPIVKGPIQAKLPEPGRPVEIGQQPGKPVGPVASGIKKLETSPVASEHSGLRAKGK
jgi:hypothetical protein